MECRHGSRARKQSHPSPVRDHAGCVGQPGGGDRGRDLGDHLSNSRGRSHNGPESRRSSGKTRLARQAKSWRPLSVSANRRTRSRGRTCGRRIRRRVLQRLRQQPGDESAGIAEYFTRRGRSTPRDVGKTAFENQEVKGGRKMTLASMHILSLATVVYLANVAIASLVACGTASVALRVYRKAPLPLGHAVLVVALIATLAGPLVLALPHTNFSLFAFTTHSDVMQPRELGLGPQSDDWHPITEFDSTNRVAQRTTPSITPSPATNNATVDAPVSHPVPSPIVSAAPSRWSWPNMIELAGNSLALVWSIGFAWASWQLAR